MPSLVLRSGLAKSKTHYLDLVFTVLRCLKTYSGSQRNNELIAASDTNKNAFSETDKLRYRFDASALCLAYRWCGLAE
jgi:hypothetical protein